VFERRGLASETVKGLSLTLKSVDDVHSDNGLTAGMLSVGYRVTDDVLKEYLEYTTSLFVDKTGDTLDSTTTGETTDGGLGDSLDIITEYLPVTLSSSLS
jgi:hypothetical protein